MEGGALSPPITAAKPPLSHIAPRRFFVTNSSLPFTPQEATLSAFQFEHSPFWHVSVGFVKEIANRTRQYNLLS
jgi:hypothetical protein